MKLNPDEGTFEVIAWLNSNADTHEVDSIDILTVTGEKIPQVILDHLREHPHPSNAFESGWNSKIDWDNIPLDTTYRLYIEWTFEGREFSLYLSTLEGPLKDE